MFIPQGRYLTVNQYRVKMGMKSCSTIWRAVREGRIKGAVQVDRGVTLIPEDAVIINKSVKHGRYIGVSAWLRGEVVHQEEVKQWELRQKQLKQLKK